MVSPSFLLAYSIQLGVLAAAAGLVLASAASLQPRLRLAIWRSVLLAAWLLPAAALWPSASGPAGSTASSSLILSAFAVLDAGRAGARAAAQVDWPFWMTVLLVGGAAVRLAVVGLAALHVTRRVARMSSAEVPLFEQIRAALGVDTRLACHASVPHPFTVGHGPATVVVPQALLSAPDDTQRAVFTHELLHVARRDWRAMLAEEIAAAPLWFHPAAWLARRELRQAREEIVDLAVVARLGARRSYLEMLVAFAERPAGGLTLALPVLAARQLPRRVATLLSEVPMSRTRFALTCALVAVTCSAGLAAAARAVPLPAIGWIDEFAGSPQTASSGPGPLERTAYVAPRDMAPPPRVTYVAPAIPPSFSDMGDVDVSLRLVLDAQGRVAEARALELKASRMEPPRVDALSAALMAAVKRWRFEPPAAAPVAVTSSLTLVPTSKDGTTVFSIRERPIPIVVKQAAYPEADEKAKTEGTAEVELTVDAAGRVSGTRLVNATTPAMGEAAIAALREYTFRPGMKDGTPVPVVITIATRFALR